MALYPLNSLGLLSKYFPHRNSRSREFPSEPYQAFDEAITPMLQIFSRSRTGTISQLTVRKLAQP